MPINFLDSFDSKNWLILGPLFLQSVPISLLLLNPASTGAVVVAVAETPPTLPRCDALQGSSFCSSIFSKNKEDKGNINACNLTLTNF
uniref:Uncharacterized protein n=1 Tax=Cucumis melo TaxID=3656 RepID=A0A9I9E5Z9_CUCME